MAHHGDTYEKTALALRSLAELLEGQAGGRPVDLDTLLDKYIEARTTLARELRELTAGLLPEQETLLDKARQAIEARMKELYGGRVPDRYLKVNGYSRVHPLLLEYLVHHCGELVSESRLRVLGGEQGQIERRIRDFTDLGFDIEFIKALGDNQYCLTSKSPNVDFAAKLLLRRNLEADKKLSGLERREMMDKVLRR